MRTTTLTIPQERPNKRDRTDLLIIGTLGGGGIHHYINEQCNRLSDDLNVSVYNMESNPTGSGIIWFIDSFLRSIWAAAKFPIRIPSDIVHVHTSHRFSFYRASFYVFFVSLIWRRPIILHIHGSSFDDFAETNNPALRWLQSTVFEVVDRKPRVGRNPRTREPVPIPPRRVVTFRPSEKLKLRMNPHLDQD
jgi:hypothetical protein